MIEVPSEDDGFALQPGIAALQQTDDVGSGRAPHAQVDDAHGDDRLAQGHGNGFQRLVERGLQLGRRPARVGEQRGADAIVDREVGDFDAVVVRERLGRPAREALHDSGNARQALQIGRVLAVRLADDQRADRAVPLCVQDLETHVRRGRVAYAVEDGCGVGLLRLVVEHQHDLAPCVEACVVVVVELRRGDSEPGEHHRRLDLDVAGKETDEVFQERVALRGSSATQGELRMLQVGQVFDERHGLEKGAAAGRRQPRLRELRGDELDGDLGSVRERHASFEHVRGEERQVGAQVADLDGLESRFDARVDAARRRRGDGKGHTQHSGERQRISRVHGELSGRHLFGTYRSVIVPS